MIVNHRTDIELVALLHLVCDVLNQLATRCGIVVAAPDVESVTGAQVSILADAPHVVTRLPFQDVLWFDSRCCTDNRISPFILEHLHPVVAHIGQRLAVVGWRKEVFERIGEAGYILLAVVILPLIADIFGEVAAVLIEVVTLRIVILFYRPLPSSSVLIMM